MQAKPSTKHEDSSQFEKLPKRVIHAQRKYCTQCKCFCCPHAQKNVSEPLRAYSPEDYSRTLANWYPQYAPQVQVVHSGISYQVLASPYTPYYPYPVHQAQPQMSHMAYGQQRVPTRPSSILSPVPADLSAPLQRTYIVTPSADLYQTPLGMDSSYQGFEEESSAYRQKFELSRN